MHDKCRFLLTFLALACSDSPSETALDVKLITPSTTALEEVSFAFAGNASKVSMQNSVRILLPDDLAGKENALVVQGFVGEDVLATGRSLVTPVLGKTTDITITLVEVPCGAWCTEGATQCDGDKVVHCQNTDADRCLEWAEPTACADGQSCSLGNCYAECFDECAQGERRCDGPYAESICGQADGDDCLEWKPSTSCPDGETCSYGACSSACQDECETGQTQCQGQGVVACGDLNGDGCLEWGPAVPCGQGKSCSEGACQSGCEDECTVSTCQGLSYKACGEFDGDPCKDVSPGTSCVPADECKEGMCTANGCKTADKVCDAPPADECVSANVLRTYQESGTCSADGCEYDYDDTECVGCPNCQAACPDTECTSQVFAYAQGGPEQIAVDDTHVYWTDSSGNKVMRAPKAGGNAQTLATGLSEPSGIFVDNSHVYWTTSVGDTVMRAPKAGGNAQTLATGQNGAANVFVNDTHVYWTAGAADEVMRAPKAGGSAQTIASEQAGARGLFVADSYVYWTTFVGNTVMRAPKAGGNAQTLATGQDGASGIFVDGSHVYWTTAVGNTVMRAPKAGGNAQTLATGQDGDGDGALWIFVDDTHVYWSTIYAGTLMQAPKAGGNAQTLASVQGGIGGIYVDDTHVYWSDYGANAIMRLSKCACDL